ncbi:MAG: DUF333 domain-containing protein [Candidatus Micrarchaeia archaeon]
MNKLSLLLPALLLFGCLAQPPAQIANPASEFCVARGGTLEIITAGDGSQSGVCTLATGEKCDEWAYYNGACPAPSPSPSPAVVLLTECETDSDCVVGGCSNQLCILRDASGISTCEWADYYSCYQRSWQASECGCVQGNCVWDQDTLDCVTEMQNPTPSPVIPSDAFDKLEYYYELSLEEYFGADVSMAKEEFYYNDRWSGSHFASPADPEEYQFEVRSKKDYRSEYGKIRVSNGYTVTWDQRGSGEEIHYLEFKCDVYQLWMKTGFVNQTEFYGAMDATTSACKDYQAN